MIDLKIQRCPYEIEKYSYDVINGNASEIIQSIAMIDDDQAKLDYANHLCDEGVLGEPFTDLEFLIKNEKDLNMVGNGGAVTA